MRRRLSVAMATLVYLAVSATAANAFPAYQATRLPSPYFGAVLGMNDDGAAVGTAEGLQPPPYDANGYAFRWLWGGTTSVTDIDPYAPESSINSEGVAIANDGEEIGDSYNEPENADYGWDRSGLDTWLFEPGYKPVALNSSGVVVGNLVNGTEGGWFSLHNVIPTLLGEQLNDVNDDNLMVGVDSSGAGAVWLYPANPGSETPIPVPAGAPSVTPECINQNDDVLGYVNTDPTQIFFWHVGDASVTVESTTPGVSIAACPSTEDVFVYEDDEAGAEFLDNLDTGDAQPVDDLVGTTWQATQINVINDDGQMGGEGNVNGNATAVVFNPVAARLPDQPLFIPRLIPLPEDPLAVPLQIRWTAKSLAHDPITRDTVQISADGGKTWQTQKTAKPTATTLNAGFQPGISYEVRVAATDSFNNTTAFVTGKPFTPALTDDADKSVSFIGPLQHVTDKKAVDGTLTELSTEGSAAVYSFTGQTFSIIGRLGPKDGKAELYLDGTDEGPVSFNASKTKERAQLAGFVDLNAGFHSIKLVALGDGPIDLDGFTSVTQN